jgi:hypothetical protein
MGHVCCSSGFNNGLNIEDKIELQKCLKKAAKMAKTRLKISPSLILAY